MSAFMVSIHHIRALVNAGLSAQHSELSWQRGPLSEEQRERAFERGEPWGIDAASVTSQTQMTLLPVTAEYAGAMLLAENRKSVNHRYDEDELEEIYTHGPSSQRTIVELLSALDCYEYQACESPDWEDSEAYRFCIALRKLLTHQLPGWQDAPWGIDTP